MWKQHLNLQFVPVLLLDLSWKILSLCEISLVSEKLLLGFGICVSRRRVVAWRGLLLEG